ncbi:MAG: hypothetical protein PHV25_03200 [Candidatus Pacebacteria bacterium]|nr:hypothetical protein [Candidatus Paceibacterota bacterium]
MQHLEPKQCHLWRKEDLNNSDLRLNNFEELTVFTNSSHLTRKLLKCKDCGQLYFYEFYEEIDFIGGNDPQYQTFIPVETEEKAKEISKEDLLEIHNHSPRILIDFPEEAEKPLLPRWVR